MGNRSFYCAARALVVVFALGISAFAQNRETVHFRGIINDFTPATTVKPSGPWELHGVWRLDLKRESGMADFSAALTMENSDYWLVINSNPPADPDSPATRTPHTHHIALKDAQVTWDPSAVSSGCPTASYKPPTCSVHLRADISARNRSTAPFVFGNEGGSIEARKKKTGKRRAP